MRAMPAGSAVIFRDYDDPHRENLARRYRAICRGRGVLFLVAGDARLAAAIGADGLHLPGGGRATTTPAGPAVICVACRSAADLDRAGALGADVALLSPVFPTLSHPEAEHLGPARFTALAGAAPLPVIALGGVDETRASLLRGANVVGIAAIGAFLARDGGREP